MNPPIRDLSHQEGLWRGIADGTVDVIGSDHAPHTSGEKAKPYPQSPSGMPGVQTLLPLLLNHMNAGRLDLKRLVELTSANANKIFRLSSKGLLDVGMDADITLVDVKRKWTVDANWLQSKCGWSPFEGMELVGKPIGTIVRGHVAMRDAELQGEAQGHPISFDMDMAF